MITDGLGALVTGGASGLGRAAVEVLHAAGASVVIADLPASPGEELAGSLGPAAMFMPTDVTDEDQVARAIEVATERFGGLRIAVNCAGIGRAGKVIGRKGVLPLESFRSVIEVNLVGTFNVIRLAAAAMAALPPLDGERGVIVNTASIAAFEGQVGQLPYAAAKGAVVSMCLVGARDLSPAGVRVMTIAPGTFFTPAFNLTEEQAHEHFGSKVPFPKRMGNPDEYGALVVHIAENDYLNGEVIRLDGASRFGLK